MTARSFPCCFSEEKKATAARLASLSIGEYHSAKLGFRLIPDPAGLRGLLAESPIAYWRFTMLAWGKSQVTFSGHKIGAETIAHGRGCFFASRLAGGTARAIP